MRVISSISALARNILDKPLLSYSQVRVAGYLYNAKAWWRTGRRLESLPVVVWALIKDPFVVVHILFLSVAPLVGIFFIAIRLVREVLGFLFFFVFIFLPLSILSLRKKPRAPAGRSVALVTLSNIEVDIRIEKYRKTLLEAGFRVLILGVSETPQREEKFSESFRQTKVPIERHKMWMYWRSEQFFELLSSDCAIYHANDLTSLVICYYASVITGASLVFDAHEVWAENVEFSKRAGSYVGYPRAKKAVLTFIEKYYSSRADLFVTVNSEIAERYEKLYKLQRSVVVVRNVPTREHFQSQRKSSAPYLEIPAGSFLVGYIGGLGPSRNIEGVIRALPYCQETVHFQIMGPNADTWRPAYLKLANELGVGARVHVTAGVPMHEVFSHMARLDAGIIMLENLCLNFYLFLPNKIFEYMAAGVPLLTSNFPVVKKIVDGEQLGFTFDPSSPASIAQSITHIQDLPVIERRAMGKRAKDLAVNDLYWEKEVLSLVQIYDGFVKDSSNLGLS